MVTEGETNLTFEQVKGWFIHPEEKEEVFIKGKGDSADLDQGFLVSEKEMAEAEEIVENERCLYISVRDGEGRALIKGKSGYHIFEFKLCDGVTITDAYCDCIRPCSCCHMEAVSMLLFFLGSNGKLDLKKNFTIISAKLFYNIVAFNGASVTV